MLKSLLQAVLSPAGYMFVSKRRFGWDPWQDIASLLGTTSVPVILDAGAHRGETLALAKRQFPSATVYCFEPDPDSFQVLARAAASRRNVELNQLALGDVPGSFDFFRNAEPMTNSLLSTSAEAVQGEVGPLMATREKIAVGVTTLDEFCTSRHIKRIDVLKTDCQGFDLRVLKGAQRMLEEQRVELILCEAILDSLYAGQGWFDEIIGFLRSWRYALCAIYHPARNSRFEFTFGEALFRLRRGTRVTHD